MKSEDLKEDLQRLGYKVVYVPHEIIEDHIACYRVKYEGKLICPPAADKLGIPLNEIWISEVFRPYERYILYHELREIAYRADGHGVREAHKLAEQDEEKRWRGDHKWEELKREINVAPKKLLLQVPGIGEVLAQRICEYRPYRSMEDLRKVPYIGARRLRQLRARFWCICERIHGRSENWILYKESPKGRKSKKGAHPFDDNGRALDWSSPARWAPSTSRVGS